MASKWVDKMGFTQRRLMNHVEIQQGSAFPDFKSRKILSIFESLISAKVVEQVSDEDASANISG